MDTKPTGFASPTQGYEEHGIDLNRLLIHNPPATYFVRMESGSMATLGLPQGSILIVDRSIKTVPSHSFVMLRHEGQFFCRQLIKKRGKIIFTDGTAEIEPVAGDTEIIGVITSSIQTYFPFL